MIFYVWNAVNLSNARKEKCQVCDLNDDTGTEKREEFYASEVTICEDKANLLHKIKRIIKFKVQQQSDDLTKRLDRKIAELWSAFENFKHNFQLDRYYTRCN